MIRLTPTTCVLGLTTAVAAGAQPAPTRAFITRHGADTLVVEQVERGADGTIYSHLNFRGGGGAPAGLRASAAYVPTPDGRVRRATIEVTPPGANAPAQRVTMTFGTALGDSVEVQVGTGAVQRVPAAAGALPFGDLSVASWELIIRRARALGSGTLRPATVPVFIGPGRPAISASVAPLGADSVVLTMNGVELRARVAPGDQILGMRVPAQNVVVDAIDPRAAGAVGTAAPPNYHPPAGAPYAAEDVRVPTPGGFALAGTLTRPTGVPGPVPVVVTIAGSGPHDRDEATAGVPGYALFRQLADTLGRRGIAVLRLDDRGVGASGGAFAGATSRDLADDVRAALTWLRARAGTRGDVDARRLALIGHSEGGMIAPMVAADDPGVAALVLLAGQAYTGQRVSEFQQREAIAARFPAAQRDSAYAANQAGLRVLLAANPWARFWWSYDPLTAARRVHAPVLVLQGATDRQVTPEQADTLAAAFRAGGDRDVTVRVFPDIDHLFLSDVSGAPAGYAALPSKAAPPEVLGVVADWLAARLAHDDTR